MDKNKMEEIEYYTYVEAIIDNIDINIDRIDSLEKTNKQYKYNIIIVYVLVLISIALNIILLYFLVAM